MINTNPCVNVNMEPAILEALKRRGHEQDRGGAGLQNQSIYGQPIVAAGGCDECPLAAKPKRKRGPRKAKAVAAEPEAIKVEIEAEAVEGEGKKRRKKGRGKGTAAQKAAAGGNKWLQHLAAYRKAHPEVKGIAVAKAAKASYKP